MQSIDNPTTPGERASSPEFRAWSATALASGLFSLFLGLAMLLGHVSTKAEDPLKSPELRQQKDKLRENPKDEQTKQRIREIDLTVRTTYFRQLSRMSLGIYLVIGGVGVFLFATNRVLKCLRRPPLPGGPSQDLETRTLRDRLLGRWAVAGTGLIICGLLLTLSFAVQTPSISAETKRGDGNSSEANAAAKPDALPIEELRRNWPRFRGVDGNGLSASTNAPREFETASGKNVAWKVPSPAIGFNSPLLVGDRLFFSGGDASLREVFCLDAKTGATVWRQAVTNVPGSPAKPPEIPESTGYCAPTMASDGKRVYVIFATGDVAAFSLAGQRVWARSFGPLDNPYGHATSLAMRQDRLILQLDQGDSEAGKSKLIALDGRTGQTLWQKPRKVGGSWATPLVVEAAGKPQIITLAVPWAISYSALDGSELWRAECLNGEITPSPTFAGGYVLIPSPAEKLAAIKPDGQGDVTKTHIAWACEDNVPDVTSPASNGDLVFMLTTSGTLSCLDVKDGKKLWEHDFETECHASPGISGNHVFVFSQKGTAIVVEAGRQFKELFRTELGDMFHASPAFSPNHIFLRGVTNIWCLGPKEANL